MGGSIRVEVPFEAHVELLRSHLVHRDGIVEKIEELLSTQRKSIQSLQALPAGPHLSRYFEDCFFKGPGVTGDEARLRGQLERAHWTGGFKPRESPGLHNDLVDPAEMMARAFHLWQQTRWPGHSGRTRWAQTLFNLYGIRCLALLSMRLWDAGPDSAGDRLSQIQGVLEELWRTTPPEQPVLVRDARWLIPLAQSPTTDDLTGYFQVAERVAESFSREDRSEIHKAGVRTGGGHLRSQLHHVATQKGLSLDDHTLILSTRRSNALDFGLLVQGLVPILEAYEDSMQSGDERKRLELADTICQGISPDPEMFLNRLELLGPYSMIEHLFTTTDRDGHPIYTPMGRRHLERYQKYEALIRRLSKPLYDDCLSFRPVEGAYSPYGVLYGFSSNLLEHMALKSLERDAVTEFSLEDVFIGGEADKLAWVSGWRKLPHVTPEVAKLFEYPQQFAEEVFARIERALERRVSDGEANAARTGRLFVLPGGHPQGDSKHSSIADLATRYIRSSDMQVVAGGQAESCDRKRLLESRLEGEFLVSYETSGGWVAVTKDILTEVLGAGQDAKIVGMQREAAGVLALMCPDLVAEVGA